MVVIVVNCWNGLREYAKRRQVMFTGLILGTVLFIASQSYLLSTQPVQQHDINELKSSLCAFRNSSPPRCQLLLDQLLRNATPDQKNRITEIVKNSN